MNMAFDLPSRTLKHDFLNLKFRGSFERRAFVDTNNIYEYAIIHRVDKRQCKKQTDAKCD